MLIDTHAHLNFQIFQNTVGEVILRAREREVEQFIVPGTELASSVRAVELAAKHPAIYAAIGIHPHHLYEYADEAGSLKEKLVRDLLVLKGMLNNPKVVAIGEVGMDRYVYQSTRYTTYEINEYFLKLQKETLVEQIRLAQEHNKALILHNRQAITDILAILENHWDQSLAGRAVFHCCEAEPALLDFAKKHQMFIGVDGDISWSKRKQRFIKEVPLEMLVLETDSPFLTPEPAKVESKTNEPKNLTYIRDIVALVKDIKPNVVEEQTTKNAHKLFAI